MYFVEEYERRHLGNLGSHELTRAFGVEARHDIAPEIRHRGVSDGRQGCAGNPKELQHGFDTEDRGGRVEDTKHRDVLVEALGDVRAGFAQSRSPHDSLRER